MNGSNVEGALALQWHAAVPFGFARFCANVNVNVTEKGGGSGEIRSRDLSHATGAGCQYRFCVPRCAATREIQRQFDDLREIGSPILLALALPSPQTIIRA